MDNGFDRYCGTETLLIVDDDKLILNLLSDYFCDHGYTVIKARDGEEAVDVYKQYRDQINLVLMDMVMPRKDGVAASAEIMEHNPHALIYFMSGYTPDAIKSLCDVKLIKKPFLPSEVIKLVRASLDTHFLLLQ
jgi:CheY-like chemotaxis protein